MNFLGLIAHASLLIHTGRDIDHVIQNLVQHKEKFPSLQEFDQFLADAVGLLAAGIFNLPDPVVATITAAISGVREEIAPPVPAAAG